MKLLAFIGLLALTLSCKDQTVENQITAAVAQPVNITVDGKSTIIVTKIQNSLCPTNVTCVRGGEVNVELAAIQNDNTVVVSLCKGPDCQMSPKAMPTKTILTVGGRTWTIELIDALRNTPEKAVLKVQIQ